MSEQAGRYQRSFAGLAGALVVVLLILGVVTGMRALVSRNPASPAPPVAYHPELRYARTQARFPLLAPARLAPGWRATSVSYRPGRDEHWHLGMLTAQGRYVGIEQGKEPVGAMLHAFVGAHPSVATPETIGGQRWSTYSTPDGDLGLVRQAARSTDLVVGHEVPRRVLVSFVKTLR